MKTKIYHDSMGCTQKSLQNLRNELSRRIDNNISVFKYSSGEICCGYIIVDKTTNEVIVTGDGFRTDGGGEGGAGYNTAQRLFQIFGIDVHNVYDNITSPLLSYTENEQERKQQELFIENKLLKELEKQNYLEWDTDRIISENNPGYIRN